MRPTALSAAFVSALLSATLLNLPARAQARAEQQVRDLNSEMSQQIQQRQLNQSFQWQLDQQRMRQQIDIPQSRGGGPGCPPGAVGC